MMNETFHGGCTVNTTTSSDAFWVDALGQRHAPCIGPARIVSLVPSLTELVCDLGLAGQLVGRTGFCIHPLATKIHKADNVAPIVVSQVDAKWNLLLTLFQPKNMMEINVASMKKAIIPSIAKGAPKISPTNQE